MKTCENLTLGEHLLLGRYLKYEIGYTQFFFEKNHIVIMYSIMQNDFHAFKLKIILKKSPVNLLKYYLSSDLSPRIFSPLLITSSTPKISYSLMIS